MKLLKKLNKDEGVFLLECGHIKRIGLIKYRKGEYKCQECALEKLYKDAARVGLICISTDISGIRNNYKFIKCQHEVSLTPQNIRNSNLNLRCKTCFDQELKDGAFRNNLEILSTNLKVKSSTRLCMFKCCGLTKQTSIKSIIGNTRCPNCYPDLLNKKISSESDLIVIETETIKRDYRLFLLPCGHTKHMKIATAKNNLWICQECNSDVRSKKTCVYLLKITCGPFSWLKLGYAHNVKNRILHYGLLKNRSVEKLCHLDFKNAIDALNFEKRIHLKYLLEKLDSEYMKKYMRKSGYTECYPIQLQETILTEFAKELNE